MTFVINLLNKDFSLLAADKLANIIGPATIKFGDVTIHAESGATIDGYEKIYTNRDGFMAVGIAGDATSHSYVTGLSQVSSISIGLREIRKHMENFLAVEDRSALLEMESIVINQGISTFYDHETATYFSNLYLFSKIHNHTRLYARSTEGTQLIHIGSGSDTFENAVGAAEIHRFTNDVAGYERIDEYLDWLSMVFNKISEVDEGVGAEFVAVISTRDNPVFNVVKNG